MPQSHTVSCANLTLDPLGLGLVPLPSYPLDKGGPVPAREGALARELSGTAKDAERSLGPSRSGSRRWCRERRFGERVSRGTGATTPEKRPKAEVVAHLMTPGLPNTTEGHRVRSKNCAWFPNRPCPSPGSSLHPRRITPPSSISVNAIGVVGFVAVSRRGHRDPEHDLASPCSGDPATRVLRSPEACRMSPFGRHVRRRPRLSPQAAIGPNRSWRPVHRRMTFDSGRECLGDNQAGCAAVLAVGGDISTAALPAQRGTI